MRFGSRANDWEKRGLAAPWVAVNSGKRSITLDLKKPKAIEVVKRLAAKADVVMREFPAGRDGQARHRLRDAEGDQSPADLLRRLGLRPGRARPRDRGVRRHDPGDVRPDVDHRLRDQRPDARGLRRRRRHVGRDGGAGRRLGALPAHPYRQGPARRRRHDRRGDGLSRPAVHRAPDDRPRARAGRQPLGDAQAHRRSLQDQGRLDGAGRHDRAAVPAPDEGGRPRRRARRSALPRLAGAHCQRQGAARDHRGRAREGDLGDLGRALRQGRRAGRPCAQHPRDRAARPLRPAHDPADGRDRARSRSRSWARASGWSMAAARSTARRRRSASTPTRSCARRATRTPTSPACARTKWSRLQPEIGHSSGGQSWRFSTTSSTSRHTGTRSPSPSARTAPCSCRGPVPTAASSAIPRPPISPRVCAGSSTPCPTS